jgi:hypothetical protein
MRAKYCKCKNTYTISHCNENKCKTPWYWKQGIGSIYKKREEEDNNQ